MFKKHLMDTTAHFMDDNVGCYGLSDPYAEHAVANRHICHFGGGGGSTGSGQQVTRTETKTELSPEQRELIAAASPALKNFATSPPVDYPGSKVVPFNTNQLKAQQMALGAAYGPAQTIANRADSTSAFLSGPNLYAESNPYLQSHIQAAIRPQVQAFGETILPGVRGSATTSGQFGGSRQGIAEGIASRSLLDSIASTSSSMSNTNYQKGQDSLIQALQLAPLLQQMQFVPGQIVGTVGDQQRAMDQAMLNDQIQKFMTAQMLPYLAAKDVASVAFGMPGGPTTSTSTGPAPQAATGSNSGLQDAMGVGSLAIGAASLAVMI